jgi:hypothetical protein
MIKNSNEIQEKIIRTISLTTGFLIYFGSKAVGLSIPDLLIHAIKISNPYLTIFVGILLPFATGVIAAWFLQRVINKDEDFAARVIILITTFILVLFSDVYVGTFGVHQFNKELNAYLLPNLSFTIGISLYLIFTYKSNRKL